jgi:two-component system nitrate/nitrite response regulator NarL
MPAYAIGKNNAGLDKDGNMDLLTSRERQIVLTLVASGLSNKGIGRQLNLSEGTVKVHMHNIFTKLGVCNRTALVAMAHRNEVE